MKYLEFELNAKMTLNHALAIHRRRTQEPHKIWFRGIFVDRQFRFRFTKLGVFPHASFLDLLFFLLGALKGRTEAKSTPVILFSVP